MKPYCDLDSLGTYVFEEGFRKGYNQRKREEKKQ